MVKMKRLTLMLLIMTLCGTLLAACGGSKNAESNSTDGESKKVEKIVFAMLSFNRIPDDISAVTAEINKITKEKIGVEVELQLFGPADYGQKVNLALQSGEKMDIFTTLGQLTNFVSKNQVYQLEDLIEEYGQEMLSILERDFGPGLLESTTMNGHIYGIPVNKGMSLPTNIVYNAEMLAEVGYKAEDIQSIEDLSDIFEAIKQKFPDVVPFGPMRINPNDTYINNLLKGTHQIDFLTDTTGVGVVFGNDKKVVNLYETEAFKDGVNMMRDWFNKGYLQKDAATTTVLFSEMVGSGRGFAFFGGYAGKEAAKALSAQLGKPIEMTRIAPDYFDTNAVNLVSWMVNSRTEAPEAAVKFLNLLYTDEKLINTILYGIEGVDYEKVNERHIKLPEGKDANTVSYTAMISTGLVGSESLQYQFEGINLSDIDLKLKENKETTRSPYFGFLFDQNDVKAQMSAVTNVVNQYLPGLVTGTMDPEVTIPKFISALNDAGAQKIIESKQKQLDQWLAE